MVEVAVENRRYRVQNLVMSVIIFQSSTKVVAVMRPQTSYQVKGESRRTVSLVHGAVFRCCSDLSAMISIRYSGRDQGASRFLYGSGHGWPEQMEEPLP